MRHSLEFLRFIFVCIIAIWHDNTLNVFQHSVVVEYFFIQSGFLLYKTFENKQYRPIEFARKRINRLYCEYFMAVLLTLMVNIIKEPTDTIFIYNQLSCLIPELLMIQSIGIFKGGINPVNWYINVLFIGGFFIYSILYCNYKVAKNIIIPAIVLLGLTYFFSTGESMVRWETINCFYLPLLRGVTGMAVGVLSAWLFSEFKSRSRIILLLINLFSIVALVLIFVATMSVDSLDKYVFIFSPILIIACFEEKSWLNSIFRGKVYLWLGKISYSMLLIHCAFIPVFHKIISMIHKSMQISLSCLISILLYLLLLVCFSAMFQKICDIIKKNLKVLITK